MKKDREHILYKQNPVIRGHFLTSEEDGNKLTLISEFDLDVLNAVYLIAQQDLFASHPIHYKELVKMDIPLNSIQKLLLRKRKHLDDIKKSINNLFSTDIVLHDFTHPISGSRYKEYHTHIINKYGYKKENRNICEIEFDELFLVNILRHPNKDAKIGNFTPIKLHTTAALKSKYAKRLYEYAMSINGKETFSMSMDSMNKLFGTNHKHFSRIVRAIERIEEQLNQVVQFEYRTFKEDKLISFKIKERII